VKSKPTKEDLELARKLKFFRERTELSQFDLERRSDLSFGAISKFENSLIVPSNRTLIRIARALDLNVFETAYLLGVNIYSLKKDDNGKSVT
jgi:transcriptional regulator with XRE-family HTH domain